ncbi:hypothetical protein Cgig2_010030 [Carnegiea gigantea]|uniref:Uncharacterized protein n=1 Tax=Carnegiea gigantea TaxID=171969 RepID=A0A9Q1GM06_9CARY|nr:hypothetical protein Cgig2_010030 [Carnegiea gigantea]
MSRGEDIHFGEGPAGGARTCEVGKKNILEEDPEPPGERAHERMDGVNEPKLLRDTHLLLPKSGTRSVPSLVWPSPIPDRDGPIPICLPYENKPILPPIMKEGLSKEKWVDVMRARPIFQVRPSKAAGRGWILLRLLDHDCGQHIYTSGRPRK